MKNFLVVEDNAVSGEVISDILNFHHLDVDVVPSGMAALQKLVDGEYTAIIIDLRLPDMNGWDLLPAIRQITDTPCIAITAYDNPHVAQEAARAGFAGYFPKPLDELGFVDQLAHILNP